MFFWFDSREDKDGKRIVRIHDLRRSAHYEMRKAGIDAKTRRAILGHKTGSMDDRYTIIDDEAMSDAIEKMRAYQKRKGMMKDDLETTVTNLSDAEWDRLMALRRSGRATLADATPPLP